jgi:RNA polymerase sigma-70 factor, ECF subfamily
MEAPEPYSDAELAKRCAAGSEKAWTHLYSQYHPLIEGVIKRYVHSSSLEDRKDICQLVYVRLVDALDRYDHKLGSLRSFISLIAQRTSFDWVKGQSTLSRIGKNEPVNHHDDSETGAIMLQSQVDPPDEEVARAECVILVRVALNSLSKMCQELLKLRFFSDLTHKEISDKLRKKENTVNVQILRCIAHLKTAYDKLGSQGLNP